MGLLKWLARRGAVGGTARWAANGYRFFRQRHPELSDADLFRLMVVARYEILPHPKAEQSLLSNANALAGLRELVVAVLTVEARFAENTLPNQAVFLEVIEEDLEKKGIPPEVIFGSTSRAVE